MQGFMQHLVISASMLRLSQTDTDVMGITLQHFPHNNTAPIVQQTLDTSDIFMTRCVSQQIEKSRDLRIRDYLWTDSDPCLLLQGADGLHWPVPGDTIILKCSE